MHHPIEDLLEHLPPDPDKSIARIIEHFHQYSSDSKFETPADEIEFILPYYTALYAILDNDDSDKKARYFRPTPCDQDGYPLLRKIDFDQDLSNALSCIYDYLNAVRERNASVMAAKKFDSIVSQTKSRLGKIAYYKFEDHEIKQIQGILNSLRHEIQKSNMFDDAHKRRILMRLETLQTELHKKLSDLDRFWGLIGDAGVAMKKFGEDAKPFVDRIKELTQIVWKAQARGEAVEADSGPPLITRKE